MYYTATSFSYDALRFGRAHELISLASTLAQHPIQEIIKVVDIPAPFVAKVLDHDETRGCLLGATCSGGTQANVWLDLTDKGGSTDQNLSFVRLRPCGCKSSKPCATVSTPSNRHIQLAMLRSVPTRTAELTARRYYRPAEHLQVP